MDTQAGAIVSFWIPSYLIKKQSFLIHNLPSFVRCHHRVLGVIMSTLNHISYDSREKGETCRSYPQIQKAACLIWGYLQDKSVGTVRLDQSAVSQSCLVTVP